MIQLEGPNQTRFPSRVVPEGVIRDATVRIHVAVTAEVVGLPDDRPAEVVGIQSEIKVRYGNQTINLL